MEPPPTTPLQDAFMRRAEALGATAPSSALALADLPRLSAAELDDLIRRGLTVQTDRWHYYVRRTLSDEENRRQPSRGLGRGLWIRNSDAFAAGRLWKVVLSWILIIIVIRMLVEWVVRR